MAGAAAPPGAGSDNLAGANCPAGANPGPWRTLLKRKSYTLKPILEMLSIYMVDLEPHAEAH